MMSQKCFSIMHGRLLINFVRTFRISRYYSESYGESTTRLGCDVELTRHRKKPQFGGRRLVQSHLYDFNAWDDVQWDEEQQTAAEEKVSLNSKTKITEERCKDLEDNAGKNWDLFYGIHDNKFFKDRQWLFTEFPELNPSTDADPDKELRILEIGCGVGNTVFPILRHCSPEQKVFIYASDFSEKAISILKESPDYDTSRCLAFVCDATADDWRPPFEEGSLDIVVLIFALSAIHPDKFSHVVQMIKKYLAPGGVVLFRDYGRHDLAQLRFKDGHCLEDNFYARGDGTLVYFFTQEDTRELFGGAGLVEEQNLVDRRLQVNRSKLLKMYRVWVQAKYRKPLDR